MILQFIVPGIPIAQPRQRHRVMKIGNRMVAHNYTPVSDPVNAFKAAVQLAASQERNGGTLVNPPIHLRCVFVLPRPQSKMWKTRPMPREPHCSRPDCDNLAKSVMDCLTGVLWTDDVMVSRLEVEKWIASGDEAPHTEIMVVSE